MKNYNNKVYLGPFEQLLTMDKMPLKGPLSDDDLEIFTDAGIFINNGLVEETGKFDKLLPKAEKKGYDIQRLDFPATCLPGFIDCHTHICYAGSRSDDFSKRLSVKTYLEIAREGGGIQSTMKKTREATKELLTKGVISRASRLLYNGITTVEVKSGYCLNVEGELKMLEAIQDAGNQLQIGLVPTCLAAHLSPYDFQSSPGDYLDMIIQKVFPVLLQKKLTTRIDIFVEEGAFSVEDAEYYLKEAQKQGFHVVVHGDQFSQGGSWLAAELGAVSVDHLETSDKKDIEHLSKSNVIPVVLPGASVGLGYNFAPARKILDAGCSLAISSDWNPGSAPMGHLLVLASILATYEKLTMAEVFAGITFRAAKALSLDDRGVLEKGKLADFCIFPCSDYREMIYNQGMMAPVQVWKSGMQVK
jgi:imidazolonepropionase